MVRHQLALAQPNLHIRLDDGARIGAGDPVEAVGDGPNLHAPELRVDHFRGKRPGEWHGRYRDLSQISSSKLHGIPFCPDTALTWLAACNRIRLPETRHGSRVTPLSPPETVGRSPWARFRFSTNVILSEPRSRGHRSQDPCRASPLDRRRAASRDHSPRSGNWSGHERSGFCAGRGFRNAGVGPPSLSRTVPTVSALLERAPLPSR